MKRKMRKFTLVLSLLIFTFSIPAFSAPATPTRPSDVGGQAEVQTYDDLLRAIRQVRTASQKRIDQAINQEKVRAAWETGKLIDEHVLHHKERADYAKQVMPRLARDLGTSERELYYMLEFARDYPMLPGPSGLTWSHYRELLAIHDEVQRKEIAERAVKEKWGHKRIREEILRLQIPKRLAEEKGAELFLPISPGKPGTYRVVVAVDGPYKKQLALDLGFSSFFRPAKFGKFKPGDIVSVVGTTKRGQAKSEKSPFLPVPFLTRKSNEGGHAGPPLRLLKNATSADLFTYPAYVRHVVDGDTFFAMIDLGFGFTTIQKLRLRGLDAPEIESTEGQKAKEFLSRLLARPSLPRMAISTSVLVHTEKSDKYDRYLADVWVDETYVNQELLNHGLAVRVNE